MLIILHLIRKLALRHKTFDLFSAGGGSFFEADVQIADLLFPLRISLMTINN